MGPENKVVLIYSFRLFWSQLKDDFQVVGMGMREQVLHILFVDNELIWRVSLEIHQNDGTRQYQPSYLHM